MLAGWHVDAADAAGSLSCVDHPAQLKRSQPRNTAVAQGEPAAPPRRHPYIGAGDLPGQLTSQSKVVRASYLPARRVPAVYLMFPRYLPGKLTAPTAASSARRQPNQPCDKAATSWRMDTLGIEPRASRMLSGCDTTTPRALKGVDFKNGPKMLDTPTC